MKSGGAGPAVYTPGAMLELPVEMAATRRAAGKKRRAERVMARLLGRVVALRAFGRILARQECTGVLCNYKDPTAAARAPSDTAMSKRHRGP